MKMLVEFDGKKMVKLTLESEGADDPEVLQHFYELYRYGKKLNEGQE